MNNDERIALAARVKSWAENLTYEDYVEFVNRWHTRMTNPADTHYEHDVGPVVGLSYFDLHIHTLQAMENELRYTRETT